MSSFSASPFSPVPSQNISTPSPTASPQLPHNSHSSQALPLSKGSDPGFEAWNFEGQVAESFPAPPLGTVAVPQPVNGSQNPGILVQYGGFGALTPAEFPCEGNNTGFRFQAPPRIGPNIQNVSPETIFLGYGSPEFPTGSEFPLRLEAPRKALSFMSPLKAGWGLPPPK